MNKTNKEYRAYGMNLETREDDNGTKTVEGLAVVFEKKTQLAYFDEVINRHALDECDMKDVPLFANHETSKIPFARSRNNNGNSTMQLILTDEGLKIRAQLDTVNNQSACELYSAIERKDIDGMSFMFLVDDEEWIGLETDRPTRRIKKISKIFEVSAVTFPAYEQTSIYSRSLDSDKEALENAKKALENARAIEELRKKIAERSENLCQKN